MHDRSAPSPLRGFARRRGARLSAFFALVAMPLVGSSSLLHLARPVGRMVAPHAAGKAYALKLLYATPATITANQAFSLTFGVVDRAGDDANVDSATAVNLSCTGAGGQYLFHGIQSKSIAAGSGTIQFDSLAASQVGAINCNARSASLQSGFYNGTAHAALFSLEFSRTPVAGIPFDVTATLTDSVQSPFATPFPLQIQFVSQGKAKLSGPLTVVIPAGRGSGTFSNLVYSAADSELVQVLATGSAQGNWSGIVVQSPALTVSAPTPASPVQGQAFSVVVSTAGSSGGRAFPVPKALAVTIGLSSGSGTLGGPLTATIPAGQQSVTVRGLTYSPASAQVGLTASANGYNAGFSMSQFAVQSSFVVTSTGDGPSACPGSPCTLRGAMVAADSVPGRTVTLPAGIYALTAGEIAVHGNVTVAGGIADTTIISRGSTMPLNITSRIFNVRPGATLNLTGVTLTGANNSSGDGSQNGGAILNAGTLTVTNSVFSKNWGDNGAAIYNAGTLTVSGTSFRGNGAALYGGAITTEGGSLNLGSSTLTNNSAGRYGGGLAVHSGTATVFNSTMQGNTANNNGGGIYVGLGGAQLLLYNATLSGNSANVGGGLFSFGAATVTNTIIAASGGPNCSTGSGGKGTITSGTHNLSSDGSCGFAAAGDQQNVKAQLDTLANNGGPTWTMKLQSGSKAIGAASPGWCAGSPVKGVDQRGQPRGATSCSVGAYEP